MPAENDTTQPASETPAEIPVENTAETAADTPVKKPPRRRATKAAAAPAPEVTATPAEPSSDTTAEPAADETDVSPPKKVAKKAAPRKRATKAVAAPIDTPDETATDAPDQAAAEAEPVADDAPAPRRRTRSPAVVVTFQAPEATVAPPRRRATRPAAPADELPDLDELEEAVELEAVDSTADEDTQLGEDEESTGPRRRRRGRRGRGRRPEGAEVAEGEESDENEEPTDPESEADAEAGDETEDGEGGTTRRRRRRRRSGTGAAGDELDEDGVPTVVHVRETPKEPRQRQPRQRDGGNAADEDGVRGISGSTRMAAKRVRRQEGRDSGRKRAPILSEAEFLARREAVERVMVVRKKADRTQIAVLEDGILVEHYVAKATATSYAGNVYLGRVQNVLPSMEAAFVDIGKGRNAVLYAGEVNYEGGGQRKIEQVLKGGQEVLVQVTKDPIGQKGSRLTSQVTLPGRYLVYVPEGSMTGISRKLPETERARLKTILRNVVPEGAGVIIRTAAEGVSEEEIGADVRRLQAQWEVIQEKVAKGGAPVLLHGEPDLVIKVVRDIFNEDFTSLVVQGEEAWTTIKDYVEFVAPDLAPRLSRYNGDGDVFHDHRVDEQLVKALDRKVYLPSGGSLVIDRTEAMVVVDVNTGKYVGKGGNLEETVTRNNLEAAEEIARQLRLRDLGGIIVVDFIDMVLESNRDLVVRRLVECLGRDRTKHQVAEVTSLGLVQMTRKRVGQGLLESFSEECERCNGRGVIVHADPVEPRVAKERDRAPKVTAKTLTPRPGPFPGPVPGAPIAGSSDSASDSVSDGASDEPSEEATPVRRRRRGGRGSGAAGSVTADAELTEILGDATEPSDPSEPVAVEEAALVEQVEPTDPVEELADATLDAELVTPAIDDDAEQPLPVDPPTEPAAPEAVEARPRRRRAASRPAGSPTS